MSKRIRCALTWCARCHCVSPSSLWWQRNWTCPNGCGAGGVEARRWDEMRERWPHLPVNPVSGWTCDPLAGADEGEGAIPSHVTANQEPDESPALC